MPRQAHGRPLQAEAPSRQRKRKTAKANTLTALEQAEQQTSDDFIPRRSRLGEIEDDSDDQNDERHPEEPSNKRRKVADGEEDHDIDEGSDLEGGRWHEGVEDEDEDSDIDSDEAFGESDEERFADFTFRGSSEKKSPKSARPIRGKPSKQKSSQAGDDGWETAEAFNNADDLNGEYDEDEDMSAAEEEDDDLGDEAVDLATALDMNEEEDRAEATRLTKKGSKKAKQIESEESDIQKDETADEEEDDDEDEDDDDEESTFSISDSETQGDVAGLQKFLANLNNQSTTAKPSKESRTQALSNIPSRFGIASAKLSASDLLQYITDPKQRQSLKMLQAADRKEPEVYKGGIPGKLAAPLAKRQQDRLDRAAAYDKSKETLNRWIETVKQNRRAEHLSFPLPDPAHDAVVTASAKKLALTSHSEPLTDLEATIQNIMHESGLGPDNGKAQASIEDQELAFEELAERTIPLDELRQRRAELRKARDLLFREEVRAKRIKKIKSKSFRRVHRKEKARMEAREMEGMKEMGLVDEEVEREKMERRRAEERMGARHRESRWAKGVKAAGRTGWDEDSRVGVADLARRDEELRRRVEGRDVEDDDESSDDEDDEDDDDDDEVEGRRLADKIAALETQHEEPKSRLANMAFMRKAEAARKAVNDEEARQLRLALECDGEQPSDSDDDKGQEVPGRQQFGVSNRQIKMTVKPQKPARNDFEAHLSEDEEQEGSEIKPSTGSQSGPRSKKIPPVPKSKDDAASATSAGMSNGLSTGLARSESKKSKPTNGQSRVVPLPLSRTPAADDYTSPSESEDEAHTPENDLDGERETLAATIFAGPDDTAADFAREKKEIEDEEGDQVIDNGLPGWGSWTGDGISKREQKRNKGRFLTTIKGVAPDKRQDSKLDRVIINEKRVKKNGKYLATELPHPFETRQQYERSLRLPMGPEWSTTNHFNDAIKPRVLLKQGTVVKPMARPTA